MDCRKWLDSWKAALTDVGVARGDILYVASDAALLLAEARRNYGIKTAQDKDTFLHSVVDILQETVGSEGTLLFPVFTWDFCRGKGFDVRTTKGEVGALNNWILTQRNDFRRTQHPLYSFLVWGKEAEPLLALNNIDAWDERSPFAYLHRHHGKMLLLNVSLQRGFTFMHYVERMLRVPYRYLKNFHGSYTDSGGETQERSYIMYVRDLAVLSHERLPDEMLEEPGVMTAGRWGKLTVKQIDLSRAYDVLADDLLHHGGRQCYHFENYILDWNKGATHEDDLGH